MDFHYTPEENDIETYRVTPAKTIKLAFKSIFYFMILLTYGLLMMRFFVSCDVDLVNTPKFSDAARSLYAADPESFKFYEVITTDDRNEDRTILLKTIVFAPSAKEIEIGVKFDKVVADNNTGQALSYKLFDSKGNEYEMVSRVTQSRFDYGYERISFGGVELNLARNIINFMNSMTEESGYSFVNNESDEFDETDDDPNNVKYRLHIYYDDELVDSFLIYNEYFYIIERDFKLD